MLRIKKTLKMNSEKNRIAQAINDQMVENDRRIERQVRAGTWVSWFKASDIKIPVDDGDEEEEEEQRKKNESESSGDGGRLLEEGV
jgi:hypothetical protein